MKKPKSGNKLLGIMNTVPFLLALVIILAVSAVGSYFYFRGKFAFDSSFLADIEARHEKKAAKSAGEDDGRLYGDGSQEPDIGDGTLLRQDEQFVAAENAVRKYIGPYKVRLLDLYMDDEGVIYIDFGEEIRRNFSGGVSDELKLIAGLFKEIKTAVPGCTALKLLVQGAETESLGGHIDISRPIGDEVEEYI